MKLILTDLDDVCLHWAKGFAKYAEAFGYDITGAAENINAWLYKNVSARDRGIIDAFNDSKHFASLEPYEDAVDVINRLKHEGWTFIAISAVEKGSFSWSLRKQNLDLYFPDVFEAIFHVGFTPNAKLPYLNLFQPTYWVEDSSSNAVDGSIAGHTSFLLERPYNSEFHHHNVIKAKTWYEIEEKIRLDQA